MAFLAWVALVPLMLALDGLGKGQAFRAAYLCGIVFFTGTLYWFVYVTWLGTVLLMLYLSLFFGLFGLAYVFLSRRTAGWKLLLLPAAWVVLEFIRDRFLTGFGWVSLGHSQFRNLPFIQIADTTGFLGVSFLVMMVNVAARETAARFLEFQRGETAARAVLRACLVTRGPLGAVILVLLGAGLYGFFRLGTPVGEERVKVAVIQGNIPQEMKWRPLAWPRIMEKQKALTAEAARQQPDLVIWPESSFPGFIWETPQRFEALKTFVKELGTPLLVGAVTRPETDYFNSALLISRDGTEKARYDKLHLVPFGEYIPLRRFLPFLEQIVPIADFTAGEKPTIFTMKPKGASYAALICFEDTAAPVARRLVREGAQVLVNMTNDAWFQDTKAPFLHLQAAVFRCVENRRPLVRAANTGVSAFVDAFGRVEHVLKDGNGRATYVEGYAAADVAPSRAATFYTRFGDVFAGLCLACLFAGLKFSKDE